MARKRERIRMLYCWNCNSPVKVNGSDWVCIRCGQNGGRGFAAKTRKKGCFYNVPYLKETTKMFKCPECSSDLLYEKEAGAVITRRIIAVDSRDYCTEYDDFWVETPGRKRWYCGDCEWKLPAKNVAQLIRYLGE